MRRGLLGIAALAATGVLAAGCGGHSTVDISTGGGDNALGPLSNAISTLNSTRATSLNALHQLDDAVDAISAVDTVAAQGLRESARPLIPAAQADASTGGNAAATVTADVAHYQAALVTLHSVALNAPIDAAERTAVLTVVSTGDTEAAALTASATAYVSAWPTFESIEALQTEWFAHAVAGWYASTGDAGGAYTVGRLPFVSALSTARAQLSATDGPRRTANIRMTAALSAAATALTPLSSPSH